MTRGKSSIPRSAIPAGASKSNAPAATKITHELTATSGQHITVPQSHDYEKLHPSHSPSRLAASRGPNDDSSTIKAVPTQVPVCGQTAPDKAKLQRFADICTRELHALNLAMHKTPKAPTYAGGAGIKASIASNYASNYGHSNSGYSKPMTSHSQMGGHFPSGVLYNSGYMSSSPASRQISQGPSMAAQSLGTIHERQPVLTNLEKYEKISDVFPEDCARVVAARGKQPFHDFMKMCRRWGFPKRVLRVKATQQVRVEGMEQEEVDYILCILMLEALLLNHKGWKYLVNSGRCREGQRMKVFEILTNCEGCHRLIKVDLHTPDLYSLQQDMLSGDHAADIMECILAIIVQHRWVHRPFQVKVITGKGVGKVHDDVKHRLKTLKKKKTLVRDYTDGDAAFLIDLLGPTQGFFF